MENGEVGNGEMGNGEVGRHGWVHICVWFVQRVSWNNIRVKFHRWLVLRATGATKRSTLVKLARQSATIDSTSSVL